MGTSSVFLRSKELGPTPSRYVLTPERSLDFAAELRCENDKFCAETLGIALPPDGPAMISFSVYVSINVGTEFGVVDFSIDSNDSHLLFAPGPGSTLQTIHECASGHLAILQIDADEGPGYDLYDPEKVFPYEIDEEASIDQIVKTHLEWEKRNA